MATYERRSGGSSDSINPVLGAVYGAIAYVLGYVLTLVVFVLGEDVDLSGEDGLIEVAGWLFYNAQFVDMVAEASGVSQSLNYLSNDQFSSAFSVPTVVYRLLPVVVLLGVGFALAKQFGTRNPADGAKAGATLALGYFVLAILGTFVFTIEFFDGVTGGPDLVTSAIIVGVVYPVVFGAIGGALGSA